ncbi:MAG: energy-coupling factor transporter transmembrane protein EcfT [Desulfobacula sp.]|nr:energy-coupling factor transporter transmembrane protein EcfT [Desulfobacula sp.]MDA8133801.1 energy-coupling factor transporter transmembrane component T [Desulfobacteraceae bacterium]
MAEITPFTYRPGDSSLHFLDPRLKFFIVSLISVSLVGAGFISTGICFLMLVLSLKKTGLHFFSILKHLKLFLALLFFIFLARAVTTQGDILVSVYGLALTRQGLTEGGLVAFKFFAVMLTGLMFSVTTRPSSIKAAVQWFLKPVPLVPEKRVAVMISLALCFLPVILRQAKEISDAQNARCAHLQKNPVRKTMGLVLPLLKRTVLSADRLVLAMESRCYRDDRTDPEFNPSGREPLFLFGTLALCLCLLLC